MTNSDTHSIEESADNLAATVDRRTEALNRLRQAENERLDVERVVQRRLMWLGIVVGATVGMLVGYLATLITIVDSGIGEFGFQFFRPNFVQGFLRVIAAYIVGGGAVGGGIMYAAFTSRQEASSIFRWLIVAIAYTIATPLLIGFLLPLTILIFGDIVEGLRPGLWISAFVETLLGSFLDGYIFLVKVLYAGVIGSLTFVAITASIHFATQRIGALASFTRGFGRAMLFYIAAASIPLVPLAILALGPLPLATAAASFLTGEKL